MATTETTTTNLSSLDIKDEEANAAFLLGKRDVLLNNYQSACDHLSKACERIVKLRNSDTVAELGEPYFYYGQALLYLGLSEQQVFGSEIVKENGNDENENENENSPIAEVDEEVENDEEKQEDEQAEKTNDDSIPDDENVSDLERAFEILECAHMIFSKLLEENNSDPYLTTRVADLHVMLGDICNENGDHENALSHVLKAIELQETINEQQRFRLLAESFYKLGLIYELINKFPEAVESFDRAIKAVRQAIEQIPEDEKKNERQELESLLPAMEIKRNDAQSSIADRHLIAQARKILSGTAQNGNHHTTEASSSETTVKDLTTIIRHKRPAAELDKIDEETKKLKKDEN